MDGKRLLASRLRFKKVLVVLDDMDHNDQLDYLAGDAGWFGNGSRVVITTRDRHLMDKDDAIYEVTKLPNHGALQLFNQHAFKRKVPDEHFVRLSDEVVSHAKGLPLALKVWGSFLYKRDLTEWRSAIEQMKINSDSEIVDKLKISYDGLKPTHQQIFLDIACFLRGEPKEKIIEILDCCGFGAHIGLRVLIDKSLVFISEDDRIEMHDLIQDMGKYIVNMQKSSGECSRIWLVEDFEEMLHNNLGINAMEAIWIPYSSKKLSFYNEAMRIMKRLRIFHLRRPGIVDKAVIKYLPNNLRWVVWESYPCKSLPTNFEAKTLVHLELRHSSLRVFQTGTKQYFPSLRTLNLSHSSRLMQTPDFTGMPNLEYLYLNDCVSLEKVHDSLGKCNKLIWLDLNWCRRLERFPSVNVESLEYLNLEGSYELEKFPEILGRMKLESEIGMAHSWIRKLNFRELDCLVALPSIICRSKILVELDVSHCKQLESLPEEIGDSENLEKLDAGYTLISCPPPSIFRLNKLKFLSFAKGGESYARQCFAFPPVAEGLRSLEELNLRGCNLIDGGPLEDIGCLSSLRTLDLNYCNLRDGELLKDIGRLSSLNKLLLKGNKFEHLPRSIVQLGALQYLDLSDCERLTHLPELPPKLEKLWVDGDMALKSMANLATKNNLRLIICRAKYGTKINFHCARKCINQFA